MQILLLTGPTRSGIQISKHMTLVRMKKNPRRVTMFGASHNGSNSTNAFHYPRQVGKPSGVQGDGLHIHSAVECSEI